MSIETLTDAGPVHWGVMLAQGWKGELAATGREKSWVVARDWASHAEFLGFHGVWVFDHFQRPWRRGWRFLLPWRRGEAG
jgi:alkanesulfonate monooxygenase SsuD/methylene tetrahydromethanopterin reductase-like flavin-dependent oxidoreductase (luciferase family)